MSWNKQHNCCDISACVAMDIGAKNKFDLVDQFDAAIFTSMYQLDYTWWQGLGARRNTSYLFLTRHNDVNCMGVQMRVKS